MTARNKIDATAFVTAVSASFDALEASDVSTRDVVLAMWKALSSAADVVRADAIEFRKAFNKDARAQLDASFPADVVTWYKSIGQKEAEEMFAVRNSVGIATGFPTLRHQAYTGRNRLQRNMLSTSLRLCVAADAGCGEAFDYIVNGMGSHAEALRAARAFGKVDGETDGKGKDGETDGNEKDVPFTLDDFTSQVMTAVSAARKSNDETAIVQRLTDILGILASKASTVKLAA